MKLSHVMSLAATFVTLGVSLHAPPAQPEAPTPTRNNVVIIITDDQDVDSLPVMRKLMSYPEGSWVRFTDAMVNQGVCSPSRATLLTGQYAHHHGVIGNNDGLKLDDRNTLPVWLNNAGYQTGLVGKYMNNFPWRLGWRYVPPGWDYFHVFRETKRDNDLYTDEAVRFINNANGPFFLYLSYKAPHQTANPPKRYDNADAYVPPLRPNVNEADMRDKPREIRRLPILQPAILRFWANERLQGQRELMAVDDGIQRVVDAIKARGALNNTMIIFTSDNGFSWGSHRIVGKLCPYEECSNVPLLIRFPGVAGNRVETRVVANTDLPATIAEYTGVTPGLPQDGRSFLGLLKAPGTRWRDEALIERPLNAYYGIRTPAWKYLEYADGQRELYDLTADPWEMQNVAGQPAYAARQQELATRLRALLGN